MLRSLGMMARSFGTFGETMGRLTGQAAVGRFGKTTAATMWGGVAGGAYGALSDNTSILGGAAMGAGLGFAGARYGGAGMKSFTRAMRPAASPRWPIGQAAMRAGRAAGSLMKQDALLMSNKAMNGFSALKSRGMWTFAGSRAGRPSAPSLANLARRV